ncbi:MAG: radical SAM protein [Elusimicrobia bacterium]|nr:radical SAM protein [Elusimicrobiota bacterium]
MLGPARDRGFLVHFPRSGLDAVTERADLKVGFRCNNFCKFCVQGDKREILPAKTREELLACLEEGRRAQARGVVVTGGEPTLHPHILEIVRAARDQGYETIQIQSNGRTFCYEKFCVSLIEAGATEFSPSLHGSRPEIHDFLTGSPGSFLQTVAGIRNLKRLGQKVLANTVITKPNYRDLPDIARLLVSLGADQFQFAFIHVSGRAAKNQDWLVPRKAVVEPWVKRGLDIGIQAGKVVMTEAIPFCLMRGYEEHVAESVIPDTMIFDAAGVVPDYTASRRREGKAKGPVCADCAYERRCEGPWREYPEAFGWEEFAPAACGAAS